MEGMGNKIGLRLLNRGMRMMFILIELFGQSGMESHCMRGMKSFFD